MRGFLSFSRPSPILLVGLMLLSTHWLWAQGTSTPAESAVHLPDAPSRVATTPEAQAYPVVYRLPIRPIAALFPASRTAESWGKPKYLFGNASSTLTFAPTFDTLSNETTCCAGNLEHYVHRIPGADFVILRVGQQAKAHPHITRVITVFRPDP
jgi:hypothetical protein